MLRIAKIDMAPLPKPVIKTGTLGCFPLNTLSLSCVAQGHGTAILGYVDDPRNGAYKEHPVVTLKAGRKSTEYSLVGVFFTGIADALYRGKLPEVIMATPAPNELGTFLNEFLDYVEKMITLGFVLNKPNPVVELIPCMVIATPGVFFSQFMAQLSKNLGNINEMTPELRQAILGRFVRGVPDCDVNPQVVGRQTEFCDVPRRIKIAGGDDRTRQTIQNVFSAHQLVTVVENSVQNPTERLEFESALSRLGNVVLPLLKAEKLLSAKELKEIQNSVGEMILDIGRQRHAFEEMDDLKSLSKKVTPLAASKKEAVQNLSVTDAAMLGGLRLYAEALNLNAELRQTLEQLSEKVSSRIAE